MGWLDATMVPVKGVSRSTITYIADAIDTAPSVIMTNASALCGAINPKLRKMMNSQRPDFLHG
jgi:hypothetical protein